jgi:hypothetical protein
MYTVFRENREQIPFNQIEEKYKGKWVFLVNLQGPLWAYNEEEGGIEPCDPISAEILIESDNAGGGFESGIYEEIRNNPEKYGVTSEMDCRCDPIIPMPYTRLIKEGVPVGQNKR